jgi:hypothetical protein
LFDHGAKVFDHFHREVRWGLFNFRCALFMGRVGILSRPPDGSDTGNYPKTFAMFTVALLNKLHGSATYASSTKHEARRTKRKNCASRSVKRKRKLSTEGIGVFHSRSSLLVKVVVAQGGGLSVARKQGVVSVDTLEVIHDT